MKKQRNGNSRLFFIEFLIVLFFFLIISTICLKLFVQAHRITECADDLAHAQTMAASAAELLLAGYSAKDTQRICADEFADSNYILNITETLETGSDAVSEESDTQVTSETGSDAVSKESDMQITSETDSDAQTLSNRYYVISVSKASASEADEPIYELSLTTHAFSHQN